MVSYTKIRNTRIAVGGILGGLSLGVMLTISLIAQNKAPQWMVGLMIGIPPIVLYGVGYAVGHNFSPEYERLQSTLKQQKLETAIAPIATPKPEPTTIVKHSSPTVDITAETKEDEHVEQQEQPTEPAIDLLPFPPSNLVAVGRGDSANTNELLPDWLQ